MSARASLSCLILLLLSAFGSAAQAETRAECLQRCNNTANECDIAATELSRQCDSAAVAARDTCLAPFQADWERCEDSCYCSSDDMDPNYFRMCMDNCSWTYSVVSEPCITQYNQARDECTRLLLSRRNTCQNRYLACVAECPQE